MSQSPLPEYVDARKIFNQTGSFSGEIALSRLARITTCIAGDTAKITAKLRFWFDDFGRKRITGELAAQIQVQCQRCLEPLTIEVNDEINLLLVSDELAAKALEAEFDPWIIEDHKIVLADLIDEQLVLSLPIVSFHQIGPCSERGRYSSGSDNGDETPRVSPFSVLATLKDDDQIDTKNDE